jgi:hypothetical protein
VIGPFTRTGFAVLLAIPLFMDARNGSAQQPAPPPGSAPAPSVAQPAAPPAASPPTDTESSEETPDEARRLFLEGRELAAKGDYVAACERFEASHNLKPSATGPLLNLAICSEQLARYATAVTHYRDVIARSRSASPERAKLAEERLRAIESRVITLRVVVPPEARVSGIEVMLDGRPLPASSWDVDVALDGREHLVEAHAPPNLSYRGSTGPLAEGSHPVLVVALREPPQPPSPVPGYVIGGVGIALFATGAAFGVAVAVECGGFFKDRCEGANKHAEYSARKDAADAAYVRGWIANAGLILGAVGIGVGTYLLVQSKRQATVGIRATPTAQGGALSLDGRF